MLTPVRTLLLRLPTVVPSGSSSVTLREDPDFHEDDAFIAEKTKFALESGLGVILCIGETLEQKKAGITLDVVERQLNAVLEQVKDWSNVVIAYEPVWAIGTGLAASAEDAQEIHASIRKFLATKLGDAAAEKIRILYGGSANGKNVADFKDKADVDGLAWWCL